MFEKCVAISNEEYATLVAAEKEAEMLKRFLLKKLKSYGGIKHQEVEDLCAMLGVIEEKEDSNV